VVPGFSQQGFGLEVESVAHDGKRKFTSFLVCFGSPLKTLFQDKDDLNNKCRGIHTPKPMMHIAYSLIFPQNL